ncbi:hypothetical protein HBI56_103560 [Parastagonospora nodorum]|nr:hypothetical protein HBH53_090430 [Parastagonospora nodorum]KAH4030261.1 hypothetical protein HBI09_127110 [Parastagonospora nodorum]KAH4105305.1 hypothetical protein HBH46_086490 [Parastagonospora nodorum]KAH4169883.1 hypothetical protein HBH43_112140 [Parastagonospora nodorum]KAH4188701.1 hypothetical protein HBI95_228650 [Parastagonospora nodorum]
MGSGDGAVRTCKSSNWIGSASWVRGAGSWQLGAGGARLGSRMQCAMQCLHVHYERACRKRKQATVRVVLIAASGSESGWAGAVMLELQRKTAAAGYLTVAVSQAIEDWTCWLT